MEDREAREMMCRVKAEITQLRRVISDLKPKAIVLQLIPQERNQGMSEDLVWVLDREIDKITTKMKGDLDAT